MNTSRSIIIPVENQVRELDAKLLLALIAARRGFRSFIGSRRELEFRIPLLPRSIYLAKSMTARSLKMFRIMTLIGHRIAAWDEEALVHPPEEIYFSRRLHREAIKYVPDLFAWGEENAELWRRYPHLPDKTRIHLTGNPRGDMLRPELRKLFTHEAQKLKAEHGKYLLINTNFSFVNPFCPDQGLIQEGKTDDQGRPVYGRVAAGMDHDFVMRLYHHKKDVFNSFKEMLPRLSEVFKDLTIILRPHPVEKPDIYHELAESSHNIKVLNKGNVIPWILGCEAVIHNGCTTGVEAYMLEVPAISFMAAGDKMLDDGFYMLPNRLSHQCRDFDSLCETINAVLSNRTGAASGEERHRLMAHYLASQDGPLACELIVDALEKIADEFGREPSPPVSKRLSGHYRAARRWTSKKLKMIFKTDSKYRPEFQRHRFPDISQEYMERRAAVLSDALNEPFRPRITQITPYIFSVEP